MNERDAGRVDRVFKVGDRMLLRTKEPELPGSTTAHRRPGPGMMARGASCGAREGGRRAARAFTVTACPNPKAYALPLPRKMQPDGERGRP
jgi:hypothetical protein